MYVTEGNLKRGKNLASAYFFMQGLSSLLPYSTILSTLDFYGDRYPHSHASFTFPLATFSANLLFVPLMVFIKKGTSLSFRIPTSLAIIALLLISIPIVALVLPNNTVGLWLLYIFQFLIGGFGAISNATIVGLAGHFPAACMTKNATGASVAGLISNFLRAFLLIFFPYSNSEASTLLGMFIYYSTPAVILLFSIYLHFKFINSDFAAVYLPPENLPPSKRPAVIEESRLYVVLDENHHTVVVSKTRWEHTKDSLHELWKVFKHIKLLCLLMILIQMQSNMLVPGVMLKRQTDFLNPAWKVVILLSTFNLFDIFGKVATFLRHTFTEKKLLIIVIFRVVFYFTFIIQATTIDFYFIDNDWFTFVNIAIFAFTGGYVVSGVFILCPEKVEGNEKEIAGFLSLSSALVGIAFGSGIALSFININPESHTNLLAIS